MIIEERKITDEILLLAKEKGFVWPELAFKDVRYPNPNQSLLKTWLRNNHKIDIFIFPIFGNKCGYDSYSRKGYSFDIILTNDCEIIWSDLFEIWESNRVDEDGYIGTPTYKTYEETLDVALIDGLVSI